MADEAQDTNANDIHTQRKRDFASEFGPRTPKDETDMSVKAGSMTPLSKRNRMLERNSSNPNAAPAEDDAELEEEGSGPPTPQQAAVSETAKVSEVRQQVEGLSTTDAEKANPMDTIDDDQIREDARIDDAKLSAKDVDRIHSIPESAAALEEARHEEAMSGDTVIPDFSRPSSPPEQELPNAGSSSATPMVTLPPAQPLSYPAVAALNRPGVGPPSPTSSVCAETGSEIGDDTIFKQPRGMTPLVQSSLSTTTTADDASSPKSDTPTPVIPSIDETMANDDTATVPEGAQPPPPTPANRPVASLPTGSPRLQPTNLSASPSLNGGFSAFGTSTAAKTTFGSSNPFGSSSSASPFASSFGSGSGASPFASTGTSSTNAFAAAEDSNKDTLTKGKRSWGQILEAGEGASSAKETEEEARKRMFTEQEVSTGEENETIYYSVPRAKLYVMDGTEYKERGVGQLRVNLGRGIPGDTDCKAPARLVMRSEAVLRLILNVALYKNMPCELAQDKFLRFSAFEDGSLKHFTVRVGNVNTAKELRDRVSELLADMPDAKHPSSQDVKADAGDVV